MTTEQIYSIIILAVVVASSLFIGIRFKTDSIGSLLGVYIAATFLWFTVRSLSSVSGKLSFIPFLVAVFLMEQCSRASTTFLRRLIGRRWSLVASIVSHIAIAFAFLRLDLWRTLIAVAVYWFVILYFASVSDVVKRMKASPVDRRTLMCMVLTSIAFIAMVLAFCNLNLWCVLIAMIVYPVVIMLVTYFVAFLYRSLRSSR
jgi:hypothetical protein